MLPFSEILVLFENPILLLGVGVVVGLAHALEPDHAVAMATFAQTTHDQKSKSNKRDIFFVGLRYGLFWGLGHATVILLVLGVITALAMHVPAQLFGAFEVINGVMLIGLGLFAIFRKRFLALFSLRLPVHSHAYDDGTWYSHSHASDDISHNHHHNSCPTPSSNTTHNDEKWHRHGFMASFVGGVHGLMGSGVFAIMFGTLLISDVYAPLTFVSIFCLGSIIGMVALTGMLCVMFGFVSRIKQIPDIIAWAFGSLSLMFGVFMICIGFGFNSLIL